MEAYRNILEEKLAKLNHDHDYCGPWAPKKQTNKKTNNKQIKKKKRKQKKSVKTNSIVKCVKPIDSGVADIGPCDYSICIENSEQQQNVSLGDDSVPSFDFCDEKNEEPPKIAEISLNSSNISESDIPLSALVKKKANEVAKKKNIDDIHSMMFGPLRKMNHQVSYEMMPGYRYSSSVLYCLDEKQFYIRNSSSKIGIGYTCYVDECKCRMHVRDNKCYVGNTFSHDHGEKSEMYYDLCALNEMKRILRSVDNRRSPKQVFDDVITR